MQRQSLHLKLRIKIKREREGEEKQNTIVDFEINKKTEINK
jgi:hypothetical protein